MFSIAVNYLDMEGTNNLYSELDWYYLNEVSLEFSFGFLLLFYVKSLLHVNFKIRKKELLLMTPFILAIIYNLVRMVYVGTYVPKEDKMSYLYVQEEFLYLEGLAIFFTILYYHFSFTEVLRYQRKIKRSFSSLERRNLLWLRLFIIAALIGGYVWMGYYLIELFIYPKFLSFSFYHPLWIYCTLVLVFIGYSNLAQSDLATTLEEIRKYTRAKYKTSKLDKQDIDNITPQLKQLMAQEKIYRKPDLTITDLSKKLELPGHYISQAINQGLNTNFYDFINNYRVMEMKEKIVNSSYSNLTISAMAFDVGFNSKNSFNKAFKKFTDQTPTEYRKSHNRYLKP